MSHFSPSEEQINLNQSSTRSTSRLFWTLLIVTLTVVITPLVVIGYRWQRQTDLIERIKQGVFSRITLRPVGPDWVRDSLGEGRMRGFDTVETVSIHSEANVHLRELSAFSKMTELALFGFSSKRVRDEFRYLPDFDSLESLIVWGPSLDDDDLEQIATMSFLKSLTIGLSTDVTDRGLELISEMSALEELVLGATNVTSETSEKLQRSLPGCDVQVYNVQLDPETGHYNMIDVNADVGSKNTEQRNSFQ